MAWWLSIEASRGDCAITLKKDLFRVLVLIPVEGRQRATLVDQRVGECLKRLACGLGRKTEDPSIHTRFIDILQQ